MPIVTLTTDFGYTDYYVAVLKASLLTRNRELQIVDVSHSIETYDIIQGAFFIKNAYRFFPEGTIHVVAISNFLEQRAKLLAFEHTGHFFIGPDNGIFSLVFPDIGSIDVFEVNAPNNENASLQAYIGHAVGGISHGLAMAEIGEQRTSIVQKIVLQPVLTKSQIRATIIHVDHYGNVITNLNRSTFEKARKERPFSIYYKTRDPIERIVRHYGDVAIGDVLCRFNVAEHLEIAVNSGNAHELLGLKKNETIQIDFHDS